MNDNEKKVIPAKDSVEIFRNAGVGFDMKLLFGLQMDLPFESKINKETVYSIRQVTEFIPDEETIEKYREVLMGTVQKKGPFKARCRFIGFEYIHPIKVGPDDKSMLTEPTRIRTEEEDA